MKDAQIAARLIEALEAAANREAGAEAALVSAEITMVAPAAPGEIATTLARKTRTLLFMSAEFAGESGKIIASASSVHKMPSTRE